MTQYLNSHGVFDIQSFQQLNTDVINPVAAENSRQLFAALSRKSGIIACKTKQPRKYWKNGKAHINWMTLHQQFITDGCMKCCTEPLLMSLVKKILTLFEDTCGEMLCGSISEIERIVVVGQ